MNVFDRIQKVKKCFSSFADQGNIQCLKLRFLIPEDRQRRLLMLFTFVRLRFIGRLTGFLFMLTLR